MQRGRKNNRSDAVNALWPEGRQSGGDLAAFGFDEGARDGQGIDIDFTGQWVRAHGGRTDR